MNSGKEELEKQQEQIKIFFEVEERFLKVELDQVKNKKELESKKKQDIESTQKKYSDLETQRNTELENKKRDLERNQSSVTSQAEGILHETKKAFESAKNWLEGLGLEDISSNKSLSINPPPDIDKLNSDLIISYMNRSKASALQSQQDLENGGKQLFSWRARHKLIKTIIIVSISFSILILMISMQISRANKPKPPTITKVSPAMSSTAGGTEITITGKGFKAAPAPTVTIGGNPASGVKVTAKTTLKATVPAGVAGPADIVVTNAKAKVRSLPFKGFSYYEDVTVASSKPDVTTAPPEGIKAPTKIRITFNQDIDPTSVVIKVTSTDGAEVAGTTAQDTTDTKTFTFTPTKHFKSGDYTVTVSGAKGMSAGNVMATDYTMSFKVKGLGKH